MACYAVSVNRGALAIFALYIAASACGEDGADAPRDGSVSDGAVGVLDGAGTDAVTLPATPSIPWWNAATGDGMPPVEPPALEPCAAGWIASTASDGDVVCLPWADGTSSACGPGRALLPGTSECVRIGGACPAGAYPEGLPMDRTVLYVDASAGPSGDGTAARPFREIAVALAAAPDGAILAIAKGRYEELLGLQISKPITLWGACPEETIVTSILSMSAQLTIAIARVAVELRDLTIAGGPNGGVGVRFPGGSLRLRGVVVEDVPLVGVTVSADAELDADALLVRNVSSATTGGQGITLFEGARGSVRRAAIESATSLGVHVTGGAEVILDSVVVRDVRPNAAGTNGLAIGAIDGGSARVRASVVERVYTAGILATGTGSSLDIEDVMIRDTRSRPSDGTSGSGIGVNPGSNASIRRVSLQDTDEAGLWISSAPVSATDLHIVRPRVRPDGSFGSGIVVFGDGAALTGARIEIVESPDNGIRAEQAGAIARLTDVRIRDSAAPGDFARPGYGLSVAEGFDLEAERVYIDGERSNAVLAIEAPTRVRLVDALLARGRGKANGEGGRAFEVAMGATGELERVVALDCREVGIFVAHLGSHLTLSDVVVAGTQETADEIGMGIHLQSGGALTASRVALDRNVYLGLSIMGDGSSADVEDVTVSDTRGNASDNGGEGLSAQLGGRLRATRVSVTDSREAAVVAARFGQAEISDLTVLRTHARACATATCAGAGLGSAVVASANGTVRLERFVVDDAELCGLQVATDGMMDAVHGEVSRCAAGACIGIDGYDIGRISRDVRYRDNVTNLSSDVLPVPVTAPPEL